MAIYHLHVQVIQRSQGENAIAACAYRRAAKLYHQREEKFWNFTKKPHVIHSELLVPQDVPGWVQELVELHGENPTAAVEQLWNQLEASEKRVDARLVREIEFALPIELNKAQSIELARAFITEQCVSLGMIADWSVHWDKGNPHVHVLLTMRSLTENGFGHKVRAWDSKALLQTWREQWAEYANFHLHLHQHDVRIDHRSYAEQGIDLIPGIHEGKAAREMARRGIGISRLEDAAKIRALNLFRLSERCEIIFPYLNASKDTFTDQDLSQVLGRYINPKLQTFSNPTTQTSPQNPHPSPLAESLHHPESINLAPSSAVFEAVFAHCRILTTEKIEEILQNISEHESVFTEKQLAQAVESLIEDADIFAKAVLAIKQHPSVVALGAGDDGRDRYTTCALLQQEQEIQELADGLRERSHLHIPESQQQALLHQHQEQTGKTLTDEQKAAVLHLLKPTAISCVVGRAGTGKSFSLGAAKKVWEAQGLAVYGIALSGIAADGLKKDVGMESMTIESFKYRIQKQLLTLNAQDVVVMDEAGMTDSISMLAVLHIVEQAQAKLVLVGDPAQLQPVGPGATFRALLEPLGFAEIQTVYRQSKSWQREATMVLSSPDQVAQGLAAYQAAGCIHLKADPKQAMNQLLADWKKLAHEGQKDLKQILVMAHRNEDVDVLNQLIRNEQIRTAQIAQGYWVDTECGKIHIAAGDRILFLENNRPLGVSNGRFATVTWVDFRESGQAMQFKVQLDGSEQTVLINPLEYNHFTYGYAATVHKSQGMTVDQCLVYAGGCGWDSSLTYVALSRHRHSVHLYADETTHVNEETLFRRLSRKNLKESVLDFPTAFAARRGITPSEEAITKRREDARLVAHYVDAHRAVGMAWAALETKLEKLGIPKLDYQDKQSFDLIKGTTEYLAVQAGKKDRNRTADQIIQNLKRYEHAIRLYDLDIDNLQRHALGHRCTQNVQQYIARLSTGFSVYRDYFALKIMQEIKGHYPFLQEFKINTKEQRAALRVQALTYLRRTLILKCTPEEQKGFERVEAYQAANRAATAFWFDTVKSPPTPNPEVLTKLEKLNDRQNRLATEILAHLPECQTALDFYQFDKATAHFGEEVLEEELRKAQERMNRLRKHAAYYHAGERVLAYQTACEQQDVKRRLSLAYDIVQDTKVHHGAIVRLVGNEKEDISLFWQRIRKDAKREEDRLFYRTLDAVDRLGFQAVQRYVEAKETAKSLWRSFFEEMERIGKKDLALAEQMAHDHFQRIPAARDLSQVREALAQKLLENPVLYQRGLNYFGIDAQELDSVAYQHQCRLRVKEYQNTTTPLARCEIAAIIMADYKAHAGAIYQNQLNWKKIRQDARPFERKQHFPTLTPHEKSLYRLVDRYRKANQAVGRLYSKKTAKQSSLKAKPPSLKVEAKLKKAFAKRDHLAWRLVNTVYQNDPESLRAFASVHRLDTQKLLQQHMRLSECCSVVEQYQQHYQSAIAAVQKVYSWGDEKALAQTIQQALVAIDAVILKHLANPFNRALLSNYVLPLYDLSEQKVIQQKNGLTELKNTLKVFAESKSIVLKPEMPSRNSADQPGISTTYSRIDLKSLRADLNARAEQIALHYLGQPKLRQGSTWRYGSHQGSLVVAIQGAKQGLWQDFQCDVGGDMFRLIQHALETQDFKAVLQEATRFLGGDSLYRMTEQQKPAVSAVKNVDVDLDTYTQQRIQKAQTIVQGTHSIQDTLAERYLREHRGILGVLDDRTLRYHPNLRNWMTKSVHPALVIVARDKTDEVCGIQAIFLNEKTAKKAMQLDTQVKLSCGVIGGGALIHTGTPEGKIALAEGPETALSIAEAHPDWKVYVTFGVGNFAKVRLPDHTKNIVICADNDGQDSNTQKSLAKSAKKLAQRGLNVWVAEPQKPEHKTKWDFNDALLASGINQVKNNLDEAKLFQKGISKENLTIDLKKTLAVLGEPISIIETPAIDKAASMPEITHETLKTLLVRYVDMELEQTRLVNAMHSARLQDPKAGKAASTEALAHAKKIQTFAEQMIEYPEIKTILETKQKIKPSHIADRGGFIGIKERLQQGEWLEEDIHLLTIKLRNKTGNELRVQVKDRSRN